jgi:hypothetical protein
MVTTPAAIVSQASTKTTSLPTQANLSTRATYTLNAINGAAGPNLMTISANQFSGSLAKFGFTQVQGSLTVREDNPSSPFATTGVIQLLSKRGNIDIIVNGPAINVNNGELGTINSTTRLNYSLAGGTGAFANVTGTGRMNMVTLAFFSTNPSGAGQSMQGNLDMTLLPDRRDRGTPAPTQLAGTMSVMKRSESIASGFSGTQIVNDVGGAGKISPLGTVKLTGNFDQSNSNPATADTTGEFTLSNGRGSITLQFVRVPAATGIPKGAEKFAVTITDSTGAYAGASGTATALLVPVKNLNYNLLFGPESGS